MKKDIRPRLVFADASGNIYDHPDLYMLVRRGAEMALPRPEELIPLPEESELFLLPGRKAMGLDPETGQPEIGEEEVAVAAFASPGHTITGHAAYVTSPGAPTLPLFAYAAVGFDKGRFWVAAKQVDADKRQVFTGIPKARITQGAQKWLKDFPENRLVRHLAGCALKNCCPAARNLALGRFEAPLPTSRVCNAACVGCLSSQPPESGFPATQQRLTFTPTPREIVEVMSRHSSREKRPVLSFGQGCEGEPLTEGKLLAEAVKLYRDSGGAGTVNVNTNASLPATIEPLAKAGLSSIRASLNSATPALYEAYYRPKGYAFADVRQTIAEAKRHGLFVSLNFLFFPGVSDCEGEFDALAGLVEESKVDFIQLRNLNIDPELYLNLVGGKTSGPSMGFLNFRKRLRKTCPWLRFGYFNPFLTPANKLPEESPEASNAKEPGDLAVARLFLIIRSDAGRPEKSSRRSRGN